LLQIRCTKKVLDAIGIKQKDLGSIKEADSLLGNWLIYVVMMANIY